MLGFLFKILIIAAVVGGIGWFVIGKHNLPKNLSGVNAGGVLSQLPLNKEAILGIKNIDTGNVLAQVSGVLDDLITHQGAGGGPVVLGVKVSKDSIGTVVDVLQSLPNEQLVQLRTALCASPSGN